MTYLRPTSSPIKLTRSLRAALLGAALFSGVTAANGTPAPATGAQTTAAASATVGTTNSTAGANIATQAGAATTASGKAITISHLRWDYKEADFFKRISEYFTARESTGYRIILRTDPEERAGLYFQSLLSVPLRDLPQGTAFRVRFIRSDDTENTVTHTFAIPAELANSDKTQLWLGFTGADVPANDAAPVAWQISVVDAEDQPLAEGNSFLWSARDGRTNAK